jgi:UDP-glucose 4-epimerase
MRYTALNLYQGKYTCMNILVYYGAGYSGSHSLKYLRSQNHHCIVLAIFLKAINGIRKTASLASVVTCRS